MGYLSVAQSTIPDFTKAVISLWFRVPQASIDACVAAAASATNMPSVIPLITFGRQQPVNTYTAASIGDVSLDTDNAGIGLGVGGFPAPTGHFPTGYELSSTENADPSYIGLQCALGPPNTASLVFNLQTAEYAALSGYRYAIKTLDLWDVADIGGEPSEYDPTAGAGWTSVLGFTWHIVEEDVSAEITGAQPGFYNIVSPINLAPDMWHHVLLSFDLTNGCVTFGTTGDTDSGVTSYSKMWCAIDDVDYNGNNLGSFDGSDPNMILTNLGFDAEDNPASVDGFNCNVGPAEYSLTNAPIPSNGGPLGLPASSAFASSILKVEMAEFQMFTGVSLDTSVEANRRAFIAPNKAGQLLPVNPFAIGSLADPTAGVDADTLIAPGAPQKLLGKPPDIALTSSSLNWIGGINTGTSAKAGGKFKATGTIKPFLPNPVVGK